MVEEQTASKSDVLGTNCQQIPYIGLEEVGKIFKEGEIKYGRGNWKSNPTPEFRAERLEHAIRHLMLWANGDREENHLAKVAWFCLTEIYHISTRGDVLRDAKNT